MEEKVGKLEERNLGKLEDAITESVGNPEGKEMEKGADDLPEKITTENFPDVGKELDM